MKRLLLVVVLLLAVAGASAQGVLSVCGRVTDSSERPVAYCTVSLRQAADSLVVAGDVTDEDGCFCMERVPRGDYLLEFTHLSYGTVVRQVSRSEAAMECRVVLRPHRIGEVVVFPRYIRHRADRYVVSMEGNPLAREQFLSDALYLMPGVSGDRDARYKIGGQPVRSVSIDGRSASMEELETLPASSVKTVEILRSASAGKNVTRRGAKLVVVLKPLRDGGCRGQVTASVSAREDGFGGAGLSFPFGVRLGRLNLYNSLRYSHADEVQTGFKSKTYVRNSPSAIDSRMRERLTRHTFVDALNLVYDPAPRHRAALAAKIGFVGSTPDELSRSRYRVDDVATPVESGMYHARGDVDNLVWQLVADYGFRLDDRGSVLTAEVDYMERRIDKSYCYRDRMDGEPLPSCTVERMHPRTLSVETEVAVSAVLGSTAVLNGGISHYYHDERRNTQLVPPDAVSAESSFRYRGNGMAAYAECRFSLERVFVSGGLRLQWDRIDHFTGGDSCWRTRDYLRLCPDLAVTWVLDPSRASSLGVFCQRNDGEIPYGDLSPIRTRVDEFHYKIGNPYLAPARGFDLGAVLMFRGRWTAAYTFSRTVRGIRELTFIDPEDPQQTFRSPVNCMTASVHKLDLSCAMRLTPWWRINWAVSGIGEQRAYYGVRMHAVRMQLSLCNSFDLGRRWGAQLHFAASTPREDLESRHDGICVLNAGVFKYLCRNRLFLELNGRGLIRSDERIRTWNRERTFAELQCRRARCEFELRISYRFNNRGPCCLTTAGTPRKTEPEYR